MNTEQTHTPPIGNKIKPEGWIFHTHTHTHARRAHNSVETGSPTPIMTAVHAGSSRQLCKLDSTRLSYANMSGTNMNDAIAAPSNHDRHFRSDPPIQHKLQLRLSNSAHPVSTNVNLKKNCHQRVDPDFEVISGKATSFHETPEHP